MAEIEQAILALSDADWYRLRRAASLLALKVRTMDEESLLFDALERTLDGRRNWRSEAVDFIGHIIGVMRSIASHEAERRGIKEVALTSSVELIGAPNSPESALSADELIRQLRAHFGQRDDRQALEVLDAMQLGCDGPTIRAQMALEPRELETIVRRIRRGARRLLPA